MNSRESVSGNDFEKSLRGLRPSPVEIDVSDMFYRTGLAAGTRQRVFGTNEFLRMFSLALLVGVVVGPLSYRAGSRSHATPQETDFATSPIADEPIRPVPDSSTSIADVDPAFDSDRTSQTTRLEKISPQEPLFAAFPDRLGTSFTLGLPDSAKLYRLPRGRGSQFQERKVLTVRNMGSIENMLGELK